MTRTAGIVCILLLGACAAALWLLPLPDQRLALDWLKGHEAALQVLVLAHPAASLAAFTLLYIITAGLYLPGVAALQTTVRA